MVKILIKDDNAFYHYGLEHFLRALPDGYFGKGCVFINDSGMDSFAEADYIFLRMVAGEIFICHHQLKQLKKDARIFAIYEGRGHPLSVRLPVCLQHVQFIKREDMLNKVRMIVARGHAGINNTLTDKVRDCLQCQYAKLSKNQKNIVALYCGGKNINGIAEELNMSTKQIYAFKRAFMMKFNLATDSELLKFVKVYNAVELSEVLDSQANENSV